MASYFFASDPAEETRSPAFPLTKHPVARLAAGRGERQRQATSTWLEPSPPSEESEGDVYVSRVHPDVYGACALVTVRGLYNKQIGVIVMAWVWVIVTICLNFVCIWTLHTYVNRASLLYFGSREDIGKIVTRLETCIGQNITPSSTSSLDKGLVELCANQPSREFFFVVLFIWSARALGQLAEARTLFLSLFICPIKKRRDQTVEETEDGIVVVGLLPCDCVLFSLTLVVPKTIMALLLWFVGTELLAVTRDLSHLLFKATTLQFLSVLETEVFQSFLSNSKREWILGAKVVQVRMSHLFDWVLSWPGEILKLLCILALTVCIRVLFHLESQVRSLCFQCVHDCPGACSQAFDYCENLESWPYNYDGYRPQVR